MNSIKLIILVITLVLCIEQSNGQTINWNALKDTGHLLHFGVGWDYSMSFNSGYAYKVKTKLPLFLMANFSMPSGNKVLDDFKTKIGGQILLHNGENMKGSIYLSGVFRKYANELVRIFNFGSEMKGTFGYYKPKWFLAGEIGFDKAIATHFKHSDIYKNTINPEVADGWLEPATGGNFYYGLQTGYSSRKYDITLNIGRVTTQDFKTSPLIPYYLLLGFNYKIF